jgi:hypothetical protein
MINDAMPTKERGTNKQRIVTIAKELFSIEPTYILRSTELPIKVILVPSLIPGCRRSEQMRLMRARLGTY